MNPLVPLLLLAVVALLTAGGMIAASHLIGPRRPRPVKQMPYESGMDPVGDARGRFDVRFYLVAIVFLLFDVELLFLYPWAVAASYEGPGGAQTAVAAATRHWVFAEVLVFMALLGLAYIYAWRKGVFRWR